MITRTQAIVLRSIDYRDSSKIVTCFTQGSGKIALMARGAKKPGSSASGRLMPMQHVEIVFYDKPGREVQTLKEVSILSKWMNLGMDMEKMAVASNVMELIDQVTHPHEENRPVFDLIHNFLQWLNTSEDDVWKLFPYLQLRVSELAGIGISLESGTHESGLTLDVKNGILVPASETGFRPFSKNQESYLLHVFDGGTGKIPKMDISKREIADLSYTIDHYMKHHIEGLRERKSERIFREILSE